LILIQTKSKVTQVIGCDWLA